MVCFYHQERQAVGLCKNCQRGLCFECAAEVDISLACRDRCELAVRELNAVMQRSVLQISRMSDQFRRYGLVMFIFGVAMLLFSLFTLAIYPGLWVLTLLLFALGTFSSILGAVYLLEYQKQKKLGAMLGGAKPGS
jgi:hypothetical protein